MLILALLPGMTGQKDRLGARTGGFFFAMLDQALLLFPCLNQRIVLAAAKAGSVILDIKKC